MAAGSALSATVLPPSITRALAIPASAKTGTLRDVEHIVVFMQENRSFDHYFGQMRGVRGHGDRFPITLPGGLPVWYQPSRRDQSTPVTPFRLDTTSTSAQCVGDLDHSWDKTQGAINGGRYDRWPENKTDMTMGYHTREDLPYHYALADAFTVCDNYFCSIPSQTHPNRTYLMTGMIDPTGSGGGPLLDNHDVIVRPGLAPLSWTTFPERLEAAGISWQIYQQGLDLNDDFNGNFGTNVLANFKQFIDAPAGSALHRRGMSARTLEDLANDVAAERLPQVSWILPPAAFSEHPRFTPGYGAQYTARILDALTSNPDVWSKTVLLLMYDENDGFFDHVVPPQPPVSSGGGLSTVPVTGEIHNYVDPEHRPLYTRDGLPYGLGPRVPMIVISPWSKGGFVCSEVFDHTSVIRFIESRFGVYEPNITQWRRAVCGDLTSAFDFRNQDPGVPPLPDTSRYRAIADEQCKTLPKPAVPNGAAPSVPNQEPGTKPARPLPYEHDVDAAIESNSVTLHFTNRGSRAAAFYVYALHTNDAPRRYTVGAGHALRDTFALGQSDAYDLAVHGTNGFYRRFTGIYRGPKNDPGTSAQSKKDGTLVFALSNPSGRDVQMTIADNAYGRAPRTVEVPANRRIASSFHLASSGHWYDFTVSSAADPQFSRRFAGHVETGHPSTSDPVNNHRP